MDVEIIVKIKEIVLFIIAFLNFSLALLVWYRGRSKATLHLGIMAFFSAFFALTCGGIYFFWNGSYKMLLFSTRATWAGVLMLPAFITFIYYFVQKTKYIKIKSFLFYSIGVVIAVLGLTTPLFTKKAYFYIENGLLAGEEAGLLEPVARIYILFCLVIILWNLLRYYLKTAGFKKLQLKYFILGTAIYATGGIITTALIPLLLKEGAAYIEIAAFLSTFWVILTAYAILKYRLMDIQIVIGKGVAYLFSFITIVGIALLLVYFNSQLAVPLSIPVLVPFIALLSVALFQVHKFYESLAAKYLYHKFHRAKILVSDLEERLTQVLDLDTLSTLLTNTLINSFELDKIAILTKIIYEDEYKGYFIQKSLNFNKKELDSLIRNKDFIICLEKSKRISTRKELECLDKLDIEVSIPLIFKKQVIGIIVLGNKKSKEAFSVQDLELLTTLSYQASIALKNASLFAEINKRKQELEKFYNLTVGRELKILELKKRIKELEERTKEE